MSRIITGKSVDPLKYLAMSRRTTGVLWIADAGLWRLIVWYLNPLFRSKVSTRRDVSTAHGVQTHLSFLPVEIPPISCFTFRNLKG